MRRRDALAGLAALVPAARAAAVVRVGAGAGPGAEILERVRERGPFAFSLVERPREPGLAEDLARGRLDAAAFADGVRFADARRADRLPLVVVASTVTLPMALYSRRLLTPRALRGGDVVALPSDPAGLARALVLLQNFGLVGLRDAAGLHPALRDVERNPRGLRLRARPAAALFAALDSDAVAVMAQPDAAHAGLEPARDSIGLEDARSPWAGVLAVRRERAAEPWVAALLAAYRTDDTRRFVLERWRDSVRRPW